MYRYIKFPKDLLSERSKGEPMVLNSQALSSDISITAYGLTNKVAMVAGTAVMEVICGLSTGNLILQG